MILHPGILALLTGSAFTLLLTGYAAVHGYLIYRRWNYTSSSASQLLLERKTHLISTLLKYALGFQVCSAILFIYTMDDIHPLFIGAMCATGSLNANVVGWYGLYCKLLVLFLSGFWLVLNHIDQSVETYPLVRVKYLLLLLLVPFLVIDAALQLSYFMGLEPDIITSCCGSLFGTGTSHPVSSLSGLPARPAIFSFFAGYIFLAGIFFVNTRCHSRTCRTIFSCAAFIFFILSLGSIISFISVYIYELPTHHCPFDILQKEYYFVGYIMYFAIFTGGFFGMLPGLLQGLKSSKELLEAVRGAENKWMLTSIISYSFFFLLTVYVILSSNLSYLT
jgi:hypothetical protein